MAANASERRSRVVEALGFWFVTLLICAAAGFGSYRFGREWIGDRLGGEVKPVLTATDLAERVSSKALVANEQDKVPDEPPSEAVVEVQPVPMSAADEEELGEQTPRELPERDEGDERNEGDAEDRDEGGSSRTASRPSSGEASPRRAPAGEPRDDTAPVDTDRGRTEENGARYVVRAGSFARRENADQLVQQLRGKGYQPYTTTTTIDGQEYTRVNVATYADRDKATELRKSLREEGYSAELSAE